MTYDQETCRGNTRRRIRSKGTKVAVRLALRGDLQIASEPEAGCDNG